MTDFGPDKVFCPNFQIAISQEPVGVRIWNFLLMMPTNGAKKKKLWEVRVSSSNKNWMVWSEIAVNKVNEAIGLLLDYFQKDWDFILNVEKYDANHSFDNFLLNMNGFLDKYVLLKKFSILGQI